MLRFYLWGGQTDVFLSRCAFAVCFGLWSAAKHALCRLHWIVDQNLTVLFWVIPSDNSISFDNIPRPLAEM